MTTTTLQRQMIMLAEQLTFPVYWTDTALHIVGNNAGFAQMPPHARAVDELTDQPSTVLRLTVASGATLIDDRVADHPDASLLRHTVTIRVPLREADGSVAGVMCMLVDSQIDRTALDQARSAQQAQGAAGDLPDVRSRAEELAGLVQTRLAVTQAGDQEAALRKLANDANTLVASLRTMVPLGAQTLRPAGTFRDVDIVFVDDDEILLSSYEFAFSRSKKVTCFQDPRLFMDTVCDFARETKIILDYQLGSYPLNGMQIAGHLHDLGFSRLFLLTGMQLTEQDMPDYLTFLSKGNVNHILRCVLQD